MAQNSASNSPKERLIVALDMPTRASAEGLIEQLGPDVSFYKIGLELLFADGLGLARDLKSEGKKVFLDLKFLDIANTVRRAVAQASALGVDLVTVHGHDTKTLKAAVSGRDESGSNSKLLAVTVLTSLDASDLQEQGNRLAPPDLVLHRVALARKAGFDGVVASGIEAAAVRGQIAADEFLIVTPGIRLAGDAKGDQARITAPADAIRAGATHLVVGRPITAADDPRAAAQRFVQAIAEASETS